MRTRDVKVTMPYRTDMKAASCGKAYKIAELFAFALRVVLCCCVTSCILNLVVSSCLKQQL